MMMSRDDLIGVFLLGGEYVTESHCDGTADG